MGLILAGTALADNSTIEVTWVVPGDLTFSYDLAGVETEIQFQCEGPDFEQQMDSQEKGTAGLTITNEGNKAIKLDAIFDDAWWSSATLYFNMSLSGTANDSGSWEWDNSNETATNHTICVSLADGATEEWWIYSYGHDVEETAEGDDKATFRITSSAA